jgi:hypothetical protein
MGVRRFRQSGNPSLRRSTPTALVQSITAPKARNRNKQWRQGGDMQITDPFRLVLMSWWKAQRQLIRKLPSRCDSG